MADPTPPDVEDSAQRSRIETLQRRLADGVAALRSSSEWQQMLDFASRFHRYSAANTLLIHLQYAELREQGLVTRPAPSYVAGFHTWRALGRSVERGQKGLAVLAPNTYHTRAVQESDGTMRELQRGERAQSGQIVVRGARMVRGFRVEHVFALEQTSGRPLPDVPRPVALRGAAPPGLITGLRDLIASEGFAVLPVPNPSELGGADGRTDFTLRTVMVRDDMEPAAVASVHAHELGHILLHDPQSANARSPSHRGIGEVEAESVAYIVGAAHGLDTSPDSLPYVARWLGAGNDLGDVHATANRVVSAAHRILTGLPTVQLGDGQPPGVAAALEGRRQHREHPIELPARDRSLLP